VLFLFARLFFCHARLSAGVKDDSKDSKEAKERKSGGGEGKDGKGEEDEDEDPDTAKLKVQYNLSFFVSFHCTCVPK
jgi:hypothetical protein